MSTPAPDAPLEPAPLDATERAAAERRLRETQRMLLDAQRIGQVRAWEDDLRTGLVKTDVVLPGDAAPPDYEARPKEEAWSSIHPDDLPRLMAMRQKTIETGGPFETEYRMVAGGSERIMLVRGELVRDERGQPARILGTSLDITERKRAEEALEESRRLLKLVLDTLPVGVLVTDRSGNMLHANAAVQRIWGELIAAGPERRERSVGTWRETGEPVERWASLRALEEGKTSLNELIDIVAFDGKRKTIQNSAAPIRDASGAVIGAVVVNDDVTERVQTEAELRRSRQRLLDAQRVAAVGSWEADLRTHAFEISEMGRRLFLGEGPGELRSYEDLVARVHPDDRQRVVEFRRHYLRGGGEQEVQYRVVHPDGQVRWILGHVQVVRDAGGEPLRALTTCLDITERKRIEAELQRRLRQHEAVARLGQSALRATVDLQALFEEAVELMVESSGLDFADVAELLPDDTLLLRAARGWRPGLAGSARLPADTGSLCAFVLATGAPNVVEDLRQEKRFKVDPLIFAQGIVSHVTVQIKGEGRTFGTLGGGAREPRVYTQSDVNFLQSMANVLAAAVERVRATARLGAQRQELESLSRKLIAAQEAERRAVARELHDDFGQVLTALKHNLQLRERDTEESISLVDGAIARMRDLVQDLRPPLLDELGLESALRSYFEREASRAGLAFHLELAALPVRPAPQLEITCFRVAQEALTNIIRHAQASRVDVSLRARDRALVLEVRDDGQGFDLEKARARAVQGASHGLLGMHERVALACGALVIDSAPGRGTVVRATLPFDGSAR